MKQCTYCGAELQDDARACNNCGRPVPGMQEPEQKSRKEPEKATVQAEDQPQQNSWDQQRKPQEPWNQQSPQQDPWNQQGQPNGQDPWGRQDQPQDLWGQQGQPNGQDPWGRQGQPNGQDPWGRQNQPQDPWGSQGQSPRQNSWNPQQPPQAPWGWQQNDPMRQGYGGQYYGSGNQMNAPARYNTFALWSLIIGFLASFLNGLVFIPSIIAIVFAVIGLVQISRNPGMFRGRWMAIVGLIFGVFFLVVYAYVFHMVFQAVQNPETFEQLQQYLKEINAVR